MFNAIAVSDTARAGVGIGDFPGYGEEVDATRSKGLPGMGCGQQGHNSTHLVKRMADKACANPGHSAVSYYQAYKFGAEIRTSLMMKFTTGLPFARSAFRSQATSLRAIIAPVMLRASLRS